MHRNSLSFLIAIHSKGLRLMHSILNRLRSWSLGESKTRIRHLCACVLQTQPLQHLCPFKCKSRINIYDKLLKTRLSNYRSCRQIAPFICYVLAYIRRKQYLHFLSFHSEAAKRVKGSPFSIISIYLELSFSFSLPTLDSGFQTVFHRALWFLQSLSGVMWGKYPSWCISFPERRLALYWWSCWCWPLKP